MFWAWCNSHTFKAFQHRPLCATFELFLVLVRGRGIWKGGTCCVVFFPSCLFLVRKKWFLFQVDYMFWVSHHSSVRWAQISQATPLGGAFLNQTFFGKLTKCFQPLNHQLARVCFFPHRNAELPGAQRLCAPHQPLWPAFEETWCRYTRWGAA